MVVKEMDVLCLLDLENSLFPNENITEKDIQQNLFEENMNVLIKKICYT